LMMLDRTTEAIVSLQRARDIQPSLLSAPYTLAFFEYIVRDESAAREWCAYLKQHGFIDEGNVLNAEDNFLANRFEDAEQNLVSLQSAHEGVIRSSRYTYLSYLAAERGHFLRAIDVLTDGMRSDEASGNTPERALKQLDRAFIECRLRQFESCIADERSAIASNPSPKAFRTSSILIGQFVRVAPVHVATQMRAILLENERSMPNDDFGPVFEIARSLTRGEVLLSEGRFTAGISQMRKAAALDAPADPKEYLADALVQAAEGEHNQQVRSTLLREASGYYLKMASNPAYGWYSATRHLYAPGAGADSMTKWLQIAGPFDASNANYASVARELATLRPQNYAQASPLHMASKTGGHAENTAINHP